MRLIIDDLSEHANVIGRNGVFSIKELQVCHPWYAARDLVLFDLVSRKTGSILNAGFWIGAKDMDRLARDWLQYREQ